VSCWRRSASCPLNAESALSESMRGSCIFRQSGPNAHFPCTYCVRTSLSFLVPYLPSLSPRPLSFCDLVTLSPQSFPSSIRLYKQSLPPKTHSTKQEPASTHTHTHTHTHRLVEIFAELHWRLSPHAVIGVYAPHLISREY
jgi:hypothetical protein